MNILLSSLKSLVLQHKIFPLVILRGQTSLLRHLLIFKLTECFSNMDFMDSVIILGLMTFIFLK